MNPIYRLVIKSLTVLSGNWNANLIFYLAWLNRTLKLVPESDSMAD